MSEELKPCPFCGATDGQLVQTFTRATDTLAFWSVECLGCGVEVADDASQAAADAHWNSRAGDDTLSFASSAAGQREGWSIPDDLRKMSQYASDGPWESDREWNADGAYGGGPDHGTGYDDFIIVDAEGRTLMGTENSTSKLIEEEYDEDGGTAWDQVGKRNTAFAAAAVNFVRSLLASPSAPEERRDEVPDLTGVQGVDKLARLMAWHHFGLRWDVMERVSQQEVTAAAQAAIDWLNQPLAARRAALTPVPGER